MRYTIFVFVLFGLVLSAQAQEPSSIDNPVLDGVADSGVLKHNGEYYILGTGTSGNLYVSSNLVDWRGPEPVFSMNNAWTPGEAGKDHQIHACDLNYVNGTYHLYWSVNHWGDPEMTVRIGHATADEAMGPYSEPVTETWFDSRIDPHLFVDHDGTLYFYSTKFADGNVVYGQKMDDPWTRVGSPRFLLSAHPGTWEARAESINEGQEVERYRDRYYMLFASNHVSMRWGQYAIGVAEADHPLGFNNATKYHAPVIGPTNEDRLTDHANVIVPIGTETWRYTTTSPAASGWTDLGFDDSAWEEGRAAFGNQNYENSTSHRTQTSWDSSDLWLRKTIHLDEVPSEHVQLLMRLRGTAEIYVNGRQIHRSDGVRNYATIDVGETNAFREGENVLAVHVTQEGDNQYVDVGLLDPQTGPGEAYIFSPGQPNLVRGPNGFEWWLVYLGRFDGTGKSQAVDRVHFFDRTLHVDGPTAARTPGYHAPPRPPTAGDRFEDAQRTELSEQWSIDGGEWRVRDGEARQQDDTGTHRAVLQAPTGPQYLIQAGVQFRGEGGQQAGLVAYQDDSGDRLEVTLDRADHTWTYRLQQGGKRTERSFDLPEDLDLSAYHKLRVTKNGGTFHVSLDDRPVPQQSTIETDLMGEGRPGLLTRGAAAAFDGVAYTRGWDEHDEHIRGWEPPQGKDGAWQVDSSGLHETSSTGTRSVVKGAPLSAYEFSTQIYGDLRPSSGEDGARSIGFVPVYVDEDNWLRAWVDMTSHQLVVEQRKAGEDERWTVPLARTERLYQDPTHSDHFSKRYTFSSPTLVDSFRVQLPDTNESSLFPSAWDAEYRYEGTWTPLSTDAAADPVLMDAFRLDRGNKRAEIGEVTARIRAKSTYNLRAVKRHDEVVLFVDGEEVLRVPGDWPAARVGLTTRNMEARFNGLSRFEIPTSP